MNNSPSPETRTHLAGAPDWCWALGLFLLSVLYFGATQPVAPAEAAGGEGQALHAMARAIPRHLPPSAATPYVFRIGLPMLVAVVAKSADWVVGAGFDRVNLVFNLASVWLLLTLLRDVVPSVAVRTGLIAAFIVEPHSSIRLSAFHPVSTDAAAMAFVLAGLVGIRWFEARPMVFRALALAGLVCLGVAIHEVVLVVAIGLLFANPASGASWTERWRGLSRSGAWIPLCTGVLTVLALRAWIVPAPQSLSFWQVAMEALSHQSAMRVVLSWFLVAGVPVLLIGVLWGRYGAAIRLRPAFAVLAMLCAAAAVVSDAEGERIVALAFPIVLSVAGQMLAMTAVPAILPVAALALHALSSRFVVPIGGPVETPEVLGQAWERLLAPGVTWALSSTNMWAQRCDSVMLGVYGAWFVVCAGVLLFVPRLSTTGAAGTHRIPPRPGTIVQSSVVRTAAFAVVTIAAIMPIAWISGGAVYERTFASPGLVSVAYNGARIWLVVALLLVFWSTGSRLARAAAAVGVIDALCAGAAAWSLLTVCLAAAHLYYAGLLLGLFAAALVIALYDVTRIATVRWLADVEWSVVTVVLVCVAAVHVVAILVGIVLWGHPGADNDVLGNYLPYYEWTLRHHTIAPGPYWVHFFASKGNGLGLLANALSDVQGAGLATFAVMLIGAGLLGRLALRARAPLPVALLGACVYLQHFAAQGAYAKSHTIRNTLVVYLIVSAAEWLWAGGRTSLVSAARLTVIAAVIVLSPLALAIVVPIVLVPAVLGALLNRSAWRAVVTETIWTVVVSLVACAYNYLQTGLLELHSMPSFVGRLVDIDRLGRWLDPALRYLDYRLVFLQAAVAGGGAAPVVGLPPTEPIARVLSLLLDPGTVALVAVSAVAMVASLVMRRTGESAARSSLYAAMSLIAALAVVTALRMFGGGPDSSMGRFTGFSDALALALAMLVLAMAWQITSQRTQVALGGLVTATGVAALLSGWSPVAALPWRSSLDFLLGRTSYAAMHEGAWSTETATIIAAAVPPGERADMLAFLPGFTGIPQTPFQRPDGTVYLKDYTKVLYASADDGARLYAEHGIGYFLFDLAPDATTLWSGFGDLFAPESLRSRFRVVSHVESAGHDLYLTAFRRNGELPDANLDALAAGWANKLALEKTEGLYYSSFVATRQSLARDAHPVAP